MLQTGSTISHQELSEETILGWPHFTWHLRRLLSHWLQPLTFDSSSDCTSLIWKGSHCCLVVLDYTDLQYFMQQGFLTASTTAQSDQPFVFSKWKAIIKNTCPFWSPVFFLVPGPLLVPFTIQILFPALCDWLWGYHVIPKMTKSFSNFAFITLLLARLCQISLLKSPTCNVFNQQPKWVTGATPYKSIRDFTRTSALKPFHYPKIVILLSRLFEDLSRLFSCLLPLVQLWSLLSHASYWTNENHEEINFVTKFIFALWIQIPNINKQIPVEKYQSLTMKTFIII